jgi:hypothetical protein
MFLTHYCYCCYGRADDARTKKKKKKKKKRRRRRRRSKLWDLATSLLLLLLGWTLPSLSTSYDNVMKSPKSMWISSRDFALVHLVQV